VSKKQRMGGKPLAFGGLLPPGFLHDIKSGLKEHVEQRAWRGGESEGERREGKGMGNGEQRH